MSCSNLGPAKQEALTQDSQTEEFVAARFEGLRFLENTEGKTCKVVKC